MADSTAYKPKGSTDPLRRSAGTGTVARQRPDGRYVCRVTLWRKTRDFYGRTAEEAKAKRDAYLATVAVTPDEWVTHKLRELPRGFRIAHAAGPVVYLARDGAGAVIYIGSTSDFSGRIGDHSRRAPWFARLDFWEVMPCGSREEAYELERLLIALHRPAANRQGGTQLRIVSA